MLLVEAVEEVLQEMLKIFKMVRKPKNIRRAEKLTVHTLHGNAVLTFLPADKGIVMKVLNYLDYTEKSLGPTR
jgi:hypothetical protein